MKKLTQAIALSVGASLLLTQVTDVLTNQDKHQAFVESKDKLKNSIKQVGKTCLAQPTFTLSSLHTLQSILSKTHTSGISGIHVEPQNYNIGQAIVFNLHIKVIGNETHDPLPQRQDSN